MNELMKQFQDETGIDLFGGWSYQVVNGMMTPPLSESPWMKFNQWLCNKLTWRPVSEKPEKADYYLVRRGSIWFKAYFDGERFRKVVDQKLVAVIGTHWLPIPPAPEGE